MPVEEPEDLKLKAEIDDIMRRVDRILDRIDAEDPGKGSDKEGSGQ